MLVPQHPFACLFWGVDVDVVNLVDGTQGVVDELRHPKISPVGSMIALPWGTSRPVNPRTIGKSRPSLTSSVVEKAG